MRIIEAQRPLAYGTSQILEIGFGVGAIFEMETIISEVTGKNTSSGSSRGIGIVTGTGITTIGGMATGAASSTDRG